jgi:hypothetical protein
MNYVTLERAVSGRINIYRAVFMDHSFWSLVVDEVLILITVQGDS